MAEDELNIVRLRNDFYRDGFYKVIIALAVVSSAILLLLMTSFYLFFKKPSPVIFTTDNEWRIFPPVPLNQPYLTTADLLQWASGVLPKAFTYDFTNYQKEIKLLEQYFTPDGWAKMQEALNTFANPDTMQSAKLFISGTPSGAPVIINQGILSDKYSWWVQMPMVINYSSVDRSYNINLVVQILVVRVSTLNNLLGIAIDNVIVSKDQGGKAQANEKGTT